MVMGNGATNEAQFGAISLLIIFHLVLRVGTGRLRVMQSGKGDESNKRKKREL